jgi:4-hydroxy-3-polyprenylbenzoate decarboxylase
VLVESGAVHEVVYVGDEMLAAGGLGMFPIPISTPGFDAAPYTTASHWFTRDPDDGTINIGNYRGMIKAPDRTGVFVSSSNHGGAHWRKCHERGIPLQAALVIGAPPAVAYTAPARVPFGQSELEVAGGIAGAPVEVVACKTIDMVVPAWAEVVIEGEINTQYLEQEAPFGEATGYIGERMLNPFFEVKAITHRREPILAAILSQMPPSESSTIKRLSAEGIYLKFLRDDCNIQGVVEVAFHDIAVRQICVVKVKKTAEDTPWRILRAIMAYNSSTGKIVIVVDDDIDARDPTSVFWAMATRMQPHRDLQVVGNRTGGMDPSVAPPESPDVVGRATGGVFERTEASAVLIDATRKWPYPPVSLPARQYMDRARELWEELGLPPLRPRQPWHGYELGEWSDLDREDARRAMAGEHFLTGETRVATRVVADPPPARPH